MLTSIIVPPLVRVGPQINAAPFYNWIKLNTSLNAPGYLQCIFLLFLPYSFFVCHKLVCLYYFVVLKTTMGKPVISTQISLFFSDIHLCILKIVWIICVEVRSKIIKGTTQEWNRSMKIITRIYINTYTLWRHGKNGPINTCGAQPLKTLNCYCLF